MLNYTHVIYKVTNLVTGKIYIGQHSTKNIDDGYLGSGIGIKNSIKKYGSSSFKKEILEICAKKDDLNIREIFWIKELKATDGKLGYNISLGGCGGLHTPNHFFSKVNLTILEAISTLRNQKVKLENLLKSHLKTLRYGQSAH